MDTKDKLTPTSHHEHDLEQLQEWRIRDILFYLIENRYWYPQQILLLLLLFSQWRFCEYRQRLLQTPIFCSFNKQFVKFVTFNKQKIWQLVSSVFWSVCVSVMQLLLCNAIICSEIYTRILNNSLKKICLLWPLEDVLFSDCGLFGSFQLAENEALCIKLPNRLGFLVFSLVSIELTRWWPCWRNASRLMLNNVDHVGHILCVHLNLSSVLCTDRIETIWTLIMDKSSSISLSSSFPLALGMFWLRGVSFTSPRIKQICIYPNEHQVQTVVSVSLQRRQASDVIR